MEWAHWRDAWRCSVLGRLIFGLGVGANIDDSFWQFFRGRRPDPTCWRGGGSIHMRRRNLDCSFRPVLFEVCGRTVYCSPHFGDHFGYSAHGGNHSRLDAGNPVCQACKHLLGLLLRASIAEGVGGLCMLGTDCWGGMAGSRLVRFLGGRWVQCPDGIPALIFLVE